MTIGRIGVSWWSFDLFAVFVIHDLLAISFEMGKRCKLVWSSFGL